MFEKDKIFIVLYLNVTRIDDAYVMEYMDNAQKVLLQFNDDSVRYFLIPTRDEPTRLDCINPKLVSEEEYEKVRKTLEQADKAVKEFLQEYKSKKAGK